MKSILFISSAFVFAADGYNSVPNCYHNDGGFQYAGNNNVAFSGKECLAWDDFSLHNTANRQNFLPELWPDEDLNGEVCRNPDKRPGGPWCFTKHKRKEWETCDVAPCKCDKAAIGNGVCDFVNNHKDCGYDGGDCCLSTCHCKDLGTCKGNCDCSNLHLEECGRFQEGNCRDPSVMSPESHRYIISAQTGHLRWADHKGRIKLTMFFADGSSQYTYLAGDEFKRGEVSQTELILPPVPIIKVNVAVENINDGWYLQSGINIEAEKTNRGYIFMYDGWLNEHNPSATIPRAPHNYASYTVIFHTGWAFLGESQQDLYVEVEGEGPAIGTAGIRAPKVLLGGGYEQGQEVRIHFFTVDVGDVSHLDIYGTNSEDRVYLTGGMDVIKRGVVAKMPGSGWIPKAQDEDSEACLVNNEEVPNRYITGSYSISNFEVEVTTGDHFGSGRRGGVAVTFLSHTDYPTREAYLGESFAPDQTIKTLAMVQNQGIFQAKLTLKDDFFDDVFIKQLTLKKTDKDEIKTFIFNSWLNATHPEIIVDSTNRATEAYNDELPDLEFDQYQFFINFRYKEIHVENDKLECALEEGCLYQQGEVVHGVKMDNNRRILNFETTTWNVGDVTFYPPPQQEAVYHECHKHYHGMRGYATYHLTTAGSWQNDAIILTGHKASHCVMDSTCARSGKEVRHKCVNQGIQPGCADIYNAGLDCQWIDITPLKSGIYSLNVFINRDGLVPEKSFDNNAGHILFKYDTSQTEVHKKIVWACINNDEHATECPPNSPKFDQLRTGIDRYGKVDLEPGSRRWPVRENYNDGDRWD